MVTLFVGTRRYFYSQWQKQMLKMQKKIVGTDSPATHFGLVSSHNFLCFLQDDLFFYCIRTGFPCYTYSGEMIELSYRDMGIYHTVDAVAKIATDLNPDVDCSSMTNKEIVEAYRQAWEEQEDVPFYFMVVPCPENCIGLCVVPENIVIGCVKRKSREVEHAFDYQGQKIYPPYNWHTKCRICNTYVVNRECILGICPPCLIKHSMYDIEITFGNSPSKKFHQAIDSISHLSRYYHYNEGTRLHTLLFWGAEIIPCIGTIEKFLSFAYSWDSLKITINDEPLKKHMFLTLIRAIKSH